MSKHNNTPKAFPLKQSSCEIIVFLANLQHVYGFVLVNSGVIQGFTSSVGFIRRMLVCEKGGALYG